MKPWLETLNFAKPLRGVRLRSDGAMWPASEEELRASYDRGRADAEREITERLLQQRAEMHQMVTGVLESLRQAVPQVMRETENTLISLALSVAQKLVAGFPISAALVETAVRDALDQIEGAAHFTVRLHPEDLELLQKAESPLLAGDGVRDFRFLSSTEVTRGGCLVQTQFGTVDARRETKFDLLQRSLST